MDITRAMDLVRDIVYMPDWTLTPVNAGGAGDHGRIVIIVDYRAPDSRHWYAAEGYPVVIPITRTTGVIELADCPSEHRFLRRVADELLKIHEHELREFLRLHSRSYLAPFHPHQMEGELAWQMTAARPALTP